MRGFLSVFTIFCVAVGGCTLTSSTTPGNTESFPDVNGQPALYVSAVHGSDGGDGSRERPFARIQSAIDAAKSGTTIAIAAGTYSENLKLPAGISLQGTPGMTDFLASSATSLATVIEGSIAVTGKGTSVIGTLFVTGAKGAGISIETASAKLSRIMVVANQGDGISLSSSENVSLDTCIIRDNTGIGLVARGSGKVTIIDPLFHIDPRKGTFANSIIDPLFLPNSVISGNAGGGVSIIDPLFLTDPTKDALSLTSTLISKNGKFGVAIYGGSASIVSSSIDGHSASDADGIRIGRASVPTSGIFTVSVDSKSVVNASGRAGILVSAPVKLICAAAVVGSGHGGIWGQDAETTLELGETTALVHNKLVGVAVSNGATLNMKGGTIALTQPFEFLPNGATETVQLADGVGVYGHAHGQVVGTLFSDNPRAAVLAKGCAQKSDGSPDLIVDKCSISGSKWGVVINGQYSQMVAGGVGAGTPSNDYSGVDTKNQQNTAELPAEESVCPDGQYTCGVAP